MTAMESKAPYREDRIREYDQMMRVYGQAAKLARKLGLMGEYGKCANKAYDYQKLLERERESA